MLDVALTMVLERLIPSGRTVFTIAATAFIASNLITNYEKSREICDKLRCEARMEGRPEPVCDIETVPRQLDEIASGVKNYVVSELSSIFKDSHRKDTPVKSLLRTSEPQKGMREKQRRK